MTDAANVMIEAHGVEAAPAAVSDLAAAYEWCGRLARSHYENFTIASWLMPRAMRPHMHAIYAYARIADDFADEDKSLAKLDEWERELDAAYAGAPHHPVFVALADTARRFDIPREPFADLLRAFRSDVNFAGFDTIDDLLGYARYSANPVGRLVLYLFGYRDAERQAAVRSGVQRAAARKFLAGRRGRFRQRPRLFSAARSGTLRRDAATICATRALTPEFVALMRHEIELRTRSAWSAAPL